MMLRKSVDPFFLLILMFLVGTLAACSAEETRDVPTVTSTSHPTNLPTFTPTATITPYITITPSIPTEATQIALSTQDAMGTNIARNLATNEAIPTRTPRPISTTPTDLELHWVVIETSISPNKEWMAQASFAGKDYSSYTELLAFQPEGTLSWKIIRHWVIDYQVSVRPRILLWSQDGRSLYYSNWAFIGGCGTFVTGGGFASS